MLKINFYQIKSKKNALGKAPIYLRINGIGNEINLSMNISEDPKYWDEKKFKFYRIKCSEKYWNSISFSSKKITKSRKNIDIGGSEKYIPVCREHYFENILITENKLKIETHPTYLFRPRKKCVKKIDWIALRNAIIIDAIE